MTLRPEAQRPLRELRGLGHRPVRRLGPLAPQPPGIARVDLRLALEAATASLTPLPGTALVNQLYTAIEAEGRGRDGTQAIVDAIAKLTR